MGRAYDLDLYRVTSRKKIIPWDQPDWTNAWSSRRKTKITKPKENDWHLQMKNLLGISNGE